MKKQYLFVFTIIAAIVTSCSSSQNIGTTSMPDPKVEDKPVVVKPKTEKSNTSSYKTETTPAKTSASTTTSTSTSSSKKESANVIVREEHITVVQEPGVAVEPGKYYVIIGSFKSIDNAKKYKSQLIIDGFNPTLLQNDNGLYRVAVGVFMVETPARDKISSIRAQYAKYSDVWLLVQKE